MMEKDVRETSQILQKPITGTSWGVVIKAGERLKKQLSDKGNATELRKKV